MQTPAHIRVWGSVPVDIKSKLHGRRERKKKKKPHKNQHYLRAPLLIAKDLLLFTLKNITSLRQNSDQMKLVYTRLLKIVKRWGLLM